MCQLHRVTRPAETVQRISLCYWSFFGFFEVLFLLSHFNFPYSNWRKEEKGASGLWNGTLCSGSCNQRELLTLQLEVESLSFGWKCVYSDCQLVGNLLTPQSKDFLSLESTCQNGFTGELRGTKWLMFWRCSLSHPRVSGSDTHFSLLAEVFL